MKQKFTLLLFILLVSNFSQAQFFNYLKSNAVNQGDLTYTDLGVTGTKISTNYGGFAMSYDNDNSAAQPIGFSFLFGGINYTQFVLNSDGFIKLGNDTVALNQSTDVLFSTSPTATNVIYAFNLNLEDAGAAEYRRITTGVVGSRVCTIQFKGIRDADNGGGTAQFAGVQFQIKLYEGTNEIVFVYGQWIANLNTAAFIGSNCGIKGNSDANSLNVSKASATLFPSATFIEGPYTGNRFNTRNNNLPVPGFTLKFVPVVTYANNASVQSLYTYGKQPRNLDDNVSSYVRNIGTNDKYNFPVTLAVTGPSGFTYTNIQYLDTFKSGATKLIKFRPFTPTTNGTYNLNVSVQTDDDNTNNTKTLAQAVLSTTYSTAYDTSGLLGVGSGSNTIDLAAKFICPIANNINIVTAYFSAVGRDFLIKVMSSDADTPKTLLYTSPVQTSILGANVFNLPASIPVTKDFFIVITQTSQVQNFSCRYEVEDPMRPKSFYFRSPEGSGGWNDFAPANFFRIMVDVRMSTTFLPIKLSSFTGQKVGKINKLNWVTESENNNLGFEIQRSIDGKEFSKINFVESKSNSGTSSSSLTYTYNDEQPLKANNYYRLRQLDKDGKEYFSNIITIKNTEIDRTDFVKLYPNPTLENINAIINSFSTETYTIVTTDLVGKIINQQTLHAFEGANKITLNSSTFAPGTYFVKIISSTNEEVATTKFIKL